MTPQDRAVLEQVVARMREVGRDATGGISRESVFSWADRLASLPTPSSPEFKDAAAARSSAEFLGAYARRLPHAEAVADCPHCAATFLSQWVRDVLGPAPAIPPPPGPADPPRRRSRAEESAARAPLPASSPSSDGQE